MLRDPSGKYYLWEEKFNSLNELVAFYRTTTIAKKRQVFLQDEEPLPKVGGVGGRQEEGLAQLLQFCPGGCREARGVGGQGEAGRAGRNFWASRAWLILSQKLCVAHTRCSVVVC